MNPKLVFQGFKWLLGAARIQSPLRRDVLIVEDIVNDAELIQSIVRNQGYTPHVQATFNGALLALKDRKWHRILLDLNLGKPVKRDGVEIMEGTIFAEEAVRALPNVRIVFVTGNASALDGNKGSAKFPCVIKGTDFTLLDSALSSVLSNGEQLQEIRAARLFWLVLILCLCSGVAAHLACVYNLWAKIIP